MAKGKVIHTISNDILEEIEKYQNIRVGKHKVVCPYYINPKATKGQLKVMAGKGTPEEIELEAKIWIKVKKFRAGKKENNGIRDFMMEQKLGIDCSGFVVNILEKYVQAHYHKPLISFLKFEDNSWWARLRRFLRPTENISADTLTSKLNCKKIKDLNKIQPGDLIRAKGRQRNAHHVAIITKVTNDQEGNILEFEYANSHRFYGDDNGVRFGICKIIHPDKTLLEQDWKDIHTDGRNYFFEDLEVDFKDNGIRRMRGVDLALDAT